MPTFHYLASGPKGENIRGSLPANDRGEVAKKLKDKGLFLISCKADQDTAVAAQDAPSRAGAGRRSASMSLTSDAPMERTITETPSWWSSLLSQKVKPESGGKPRGRVGLKELVVFTRQVSISINAGMSIVDALQSIQQHAKNPMLSYVLRKVLDDVLSGKKLSEALSAYPEVFKAVFVNMVAAGEAGGFVPQALNRVAEFLEKEIEMKAKVKSAMVYPIVIAIVAFAVITFMMTFIVPIFVEVFKNMNAPLPLPTRLLIMVSKIMRNGGFLTPLVFIGLFIWARKVREKNEAFRQLWDERILGMPVFGKLVTLTIITRFIRTLATLVDNGVMALQAISMSRQVIENRTIEKVVDEIFNSVQQGNGISVVLYKSKYFPVLVANMVSTGERTGELPSVLMKMADYYEAEVGSAVRDLLTLMEPLLIVVMAVIVGFVIAGLMMPTFQLSSLF